MPRFDLGQNLARIPDWTHKDDYPGARALLRFQPNTKALPDIGVKTSTALQRCPDSAELAALQFIYNDGSLQEKHRARFAREGSSEALKYLAQMTQVRS